MNHTQSKDSSWSNLIGSDDLDRLTNAGVGRLATVGLEGFPTVVPICFALLDHMEPMLVSVLDEKPKQVPDAQLGRVRNIQRHPEVGFTVDHYEEDWQKLWFIQLRGRARFIDPSDELHARCIALLRAKYPNYAAMRIESRDLIVIGELRARVWHASSGELQQ